MECDDEFAATIAVDVLMVLKRERFFERLDDRMCPADEAAPSKRCDGSFSVARNLLAASGHDQQSIEDVRCVLSKRGACCDCEILLNVAEESRLKARYWKQQVTRPHHRQLRTDN